MSKKERIKVAIVDDSILARAIIKNILQSDPEIEVANEFSTGESFINWYKENPDLLNLLLLDYHLPHMNGYEVVEYVMGTRPLPIIVISGSSMGSDSYKKFELFNGGALDIILKRIDSIEKREEFSKELIRKVKLYSKVKVIKRLEMGKALIGRIGSFDKSLVDSFKKGEVNSFPIEIYKRTPCIVIGASTGGPPIIYSLLSDNLLSEELFKKAYIFIAQHLEPRFCDDFIEWLSRGSKLEVKKSQTNEYFKPGVVYIMDPAKNLLIGSDGRFIEAVKEPKSHYRPSIDLLFESASNYFQAKTIGIILSGMGKDGSLGIKYIKKYKGIVIVQSPQSCVVDSMPSSAIKTDFVDIITSPEELPLLLLNQIKKMM